MLETLGTSFVNNRGMAIFIIIMLATGTIGTQWSEGVCCNADQTFQEGIRWNDHRYLWCFPNDLCAFNVSFGGVAGFVRPIIMPMALGYR